MAGYSPHPLMKKLGIKPGHKIVILDAPVGFEELLGPLPEGTDWLDEIRMGEMDYVHFFTKSAEDLKEIFPDLKDAIHKKGAIWISWPKKASKVETDVDGNIVRETGLSNGLVDVKVCAVDEVWSGLKFMWRIEDRK